MHRRETAHLLIFAALAVAALALLVGCGGAAPPGGGESIVPPCVGAGCEPRDVSGITLFSAPSNGAGYGSRPAPSVEDVMEQGLRVAEASPVHLAVRGTAGPVRCAWRGIARTSAQREAAVRFWLELDDSATLPSASETERRFMAELDRMKAAYPATVQSNFRAIALGGLSTEYLFLACYADYTVSEYLLGAGPSGLTVAYDRQGEARTYDLYVQAHELGEFGDEALLSRGEYEDELSFRRAAVEAVYNVVFEDREGVVMLAPMGAHNAIAVEAWQAVEQWDLQEDDDEVVQAVRYGVSEGDPEHTQTLANLKARITAAATTDAFADDRIANASGLRQYYRDIGAYGDITPDDGSTATFTPAQPPAAYSCAGGTAVTSPAENLGLVHDCEALFDGKDALRGTGALNWSTGTTFADWDGITTAGTPSRVTKVVLPSESLTGTIPAGLGTLFELTHLDLSSNSLTGDIPAELGWLFNLEEVRLSGNSLTGCIPVALKDVAVNDLSSLNLLYCRPPAPGGLSAGTPGETSVALSWGAVADAGTYRVEHRPEGPGAWTVDDDALTVASHTVAGLLCDTDYQFRVSAYGSGTTYAAAWSDPSAPFTASTGACVPPVFAQTSYSFSVMEDATLDGAVGTVSATDDDTVTYAIVGGNEDGRFAIDGSSGAITVVGSLSGDAGTTATLTVEARDPSGGAATVTVTVRVTETCDSGTAVPDPTADSGLVGDCKTLLGLQSALAGTAALNWSADTAMGSWDGVALGGTPRRVTRLVLERQGLTGSLPLELGALAGLKELRLSDNQLTGSIPTALGALTNLSSLWLNSNRLMGEIPAELGSLTALYDLWLQDNDLSGPIPPELGSLTELAHLWLAGNRLTGTIPAELTGLTDLTFLALSGNSLVGCVPASLRSISFNDLGDLGLPDCQGGPSAPMGLTVSLENGVFVLSWDALTGASEYEAQWRTDAADFEWTALDTTTSTSTTFAPPGGSACSSTYEFRVRARGDGMTYATHWGAESAAEPVMTLPCNLPPEFDPDSYDFSVREDASVGNVVGTVSATDPDEGDAVAYSITADNSGGTFTIDASTGAITVGAALDHETTGSYTLMVEASDGHGGTDTAAVAITVTDVAEDLPPAPTGLTVSLEDDVFTLSWDAVPGASAYEAQWRTDAADAEWTALDATTFTPTGGPACGTEYRFRVRAYGDGETYAAEWGPESAAEPVITLPCNLPPEFDPDSYAFSVAEDAGVGNVLGTISATDPNPDDVVSYSITVDNSGGTFAIDASTGAITVAAVLDHETTASYTLTVEASDGRGGTDTATVTVTVSDVAEEPPPAPTGLMVSLADGVFTLSWDAVPGASEYEAQWRIEGSGAEWTALDATTFAPAGGPACGTEYRFRVRVYGDGETYAAVWGPESAVEPVETPACNLPPEFDPDSYTFSVAEDAAVGDTVGTVLATDPDEGDSVTYSIAVGNEDDVFAIGGSTGAITVHGELSHAASPSRTLTVEAQDSRGGVARASVSVSVASVCRNGVVIPDPDDNPGLVGDCLVLYAVRGTLAGTAALSWNGDTALAIWQGVQVAGTPGRVHLLLLADLGLDGTIPAALGNLSELRRIDLDGNRLTGGIPSALGSLSHLTHLYLLENRLTGGIPEELGNLSNLRVLYLEGNQLNGGIPAALGKLGRLTQLVLNRNQLSGSVPAELGDMEGLTQLWLADNQLNGRIPLSWGRLELEYLYLSGNSFEGCFPHGLRDVPNNDLDRPDLYWIYDCPNEAPDFVESSYSFTVAEGAATGDAVGSVLASDPDGRTVTYAITAGNDDGKFRIDAVSGEVSVAGALDHDATASYSLTIQASDAEGTTSEVTVVIEVTEAP